MGVPHSGSPGESPAVCPAPPPPPLSLGQAQGQSCQQEQDNSSPCRGAGRRERPWVEKGPCPRVPSPMRQNWACTQRDNKAPPQARDPVTLPATLGGSEPSTAQ